MDYLKLAKRWVMNRISKMDGTVDDKIVQYIIREEAQRMKWRYDEQVALNKLKDGRQHLLIFHGSDNCLCDGGCLEETSEN